jgi:protein-disulfide isomerase
MASKERFFDSLTIVALACALVTTGLVVRREFFEPDEASAEIGPIPLADWSTYLAGGHRLGPDSAPVTILTFSDFQCPACRKFAVKTWPAIRKQFGDKVALVYRHYPLPYHKAAYPAARASECAARQDQFFAFHDVLYAQQDSLKEKTWLQFATDAGVRDLASFERCATDTTSSPRVDADLKEAERIGGHGTPTVAANGYRFPSPPDSIRMAMFVEAELKRKGLAR